MCEFMEDHVPFSKAGAKLLFDVISCGMNAQT